jgi:hypothetical protein
MFSGMIVYESGKGGDQCEDVAALLLGNFWLICTAALDFFYSR